MPNFEKSWNKNKYKTVLVNDIMENIKNHVRTPVDFIRDIQCLSLIAVFWSSVMALSPAKKIKNYQLNGLKVKNLMLIELHITEAKSPNFVAFFQYK